MKKHLIIMVVLICTVRMGNAQDLNFTQFFKMPMLRNPALCGVFSGGFRAQSVYRNQWQKVASPYRTGTLSIEAKAPFCSDGGPGNYWAIGTQVTYDVAGASRLTRVQVLPVVSYHLNVRGIEGNYLAFALMGGYVSSHFDSKDLRWDDQYQGGSYSPTNPTGQVLTNMSSHFWDLGAGISYTALFGNDCSFYVGAAGFHLNRPSTSFNKDNSNYKLNYKYIFNGSLELPVNDADHVSVFGDYIWQKGNDSLTKAGAINTVMAGAVYTIDLNNTNALGFGVSYRWNDAVAPLIHYDRDQWSAGLSYDINISKLKTASQYRGGFEFSLGFKIDNCSKLPCPRF